MKFVSALILSAIMWIYPTPVTADPLPVTFASEGDSISALADNNGKTITWSWVRDAVKDGGLKYIGVYMRAGATTKELVQHAVPTKAEVMIVMGGTNDVTTGVSTSSTLNNIAEIFKRTGGKYKILTAIAPRNIYTQQTNITNYWLEQLAKQHHWIFIDPWVSFRASNGSWIKGTNADVTHPNTITGMIVGQIMHDKILEVTNGN